jgi:hypothetical protein
VKERSICSRSRPSRRYCNFSCLGSLVAKKFSPETKGLEREEAVTEPVER